MMIELNYCICIFENMGVVATKPRLLYDVVPRAPLLKYLEITTVFTPCYAEGYMVKRISFSNSMLHYNSLIKTIIILRDLPKKWEI